jgi:hypothetical protein
MGSIQVGGLRDHEIDQIESEAKEHTDGNISKYARQRLRAGRRLWNTSGKLDEQELNRPLNRDENDNTSTSPQSNSVRSDIKETIYANLSTSDPIPIESEDSSENDLVDLIIEDVVVEAIERLQREGRIQHKPRKGYIKNE